MSERGLENFASAAEVLEAAIARVERHNGTLNAVVHKAYDLARAEVRGRDDVIELVIVLVPVLVVI